LRPETDSVFYQSFHAIRLKLSVIYCRENGRLTTFYPLALNQHHPACALR
jgi:hypothetical protein